MRRCGLRKPRAQDPVRITRFKPPATNPGGNLGVIKEATCGFTNQLSHSQNRESRACFDQIAHESTPRRHDATRIGGTRTGLVTEREWRELASELRQGASHKAR